MFVVFYHNVCDGELSEVDHRSSRIERARFERQMRFLKEHYQPVHLDELMRRREAGDFDPRCVCVTFDDAYAEVATAADPILEELEIPAAVFVVSSTLSDLHTLLNYEQLEAALVLTQQPAVAAPELGLETLKLTSDKTRAMFLEKVKAALKKLPEPQRAEIQSTLLARLQVQPGQLTVTVLPRARKMDTITLAHLARTGRWTIGAHTRTHRVLSRLDPDSCRDEVMGCRAELAEALGAELGEAPGTAPRYLAYPYGKPEHVGELAPRLAEEAGFSAAFSTVSGQIGPDAEPFMLRRVSFGGLIAAAPPDVLARAREVFPLTAAAFDAGRVGGAPR